MMKVIKVIFGILSGLYAIGQVLNLIYILTHSTGNVYQTSAVGGAAAGLCIGAAISIALFKSAFNNPKGTNSKV